MTPDPDNVSYGFCCCTLFLYCMFQRYDDLIIYFCSKDNQDKEVSYARLQNYNEEQFIVDSLTEQI